MGFDKIQFFMSVATLLVVFAVLWSVLFKPLIASLDERQHQIEGDLRKAREERDQMERSRQEYEARLKEASAKVDEMIREGTRTAAAAREELLARAKAEAAEILEKASARLAEDRQRVVRELRQEVVDLAIAAAERVVSEAMNKDVHRKMVDRFVDDLSAGRSR